MKRNKKTIRLTESEFRKFIKESVLNVLNETSLDYEESFLDNPIDRAFNKRKQMTESVTSGKLYSILKQHGGLKSAGVRDRGIDVYNLKDEDILGVVSPQEYDVLRYGKRENGVDNIEFLPLKDGNYIEINHRGGNWYQYSNDYNNKREKQPGDAQQTNLKRTVRFNNKRGINDYNWQNSHGEMAFKNPSFRDGTNGWTRANKNDKMNIVRSFHNDTMDKYRKRNKKA